MNKLDEIKDYNDLLIEILTEKKRVGINIDLLIRESFTLWYILIEEIECKNFTSEQIQEYLFQNYLLFTTKFLNDADFCFIVGWMITVSFWNFNPHGDENDGYILLLKVYKKHPNNSLFKWAVSDNLGLNNFQVLQLEGDLISNFNKYFNHGTHIKNYFLSIINTNL